MEKMANDTLSLWQEKGYQIIPQNFELFHSLVAQAKELVDRGDYEAAAAYAKIAAFHGHCKPGGFFASFELEQVLLSIGQKVRGSNVYPRKNTAFSKKPKNVLHVGTNVSTLGGIPRFIRRWIQQDTERTHSIALTQQAQQEIPKVLKDTVLNNQGNLYAFNDRLIGSLSAAKQLRECAASADIIALHSWSYDIIPTIAFANQEQSPPIVYVNHHDHGFWLGASISDAVANLRESGMRLSEKRRGIEAQRNLLLPTILEPASRVLSRSEAKQKIGIDENSLLLLSIARAPKYKTIDCINFAEAHVPFLKQYERAILIVIGPGNSEDWSSAIQQTQGRIIVLGETEDTAKFYQAADIYVDSYPFGSGTSLLEAGSYGLPLVSRHLHSDDSEILGVDLPGLTGNLIGVKNLQEYATVLSRLVEDEELRLSLGEATKIKINDTHWGNNWQLSLEDLYARVASLPPLSKNLAAVEDRMFLGEPDVFMPSIHGTDIDFDLMIQIHLTVMPFRHRLRHWSRLVRKYGFRDRISLLLPEWLYWYYWKFKKKLSSFKQKFTSI